MRSKLIAQFLLIVILTGACQSAEPTSPVSPSETSPPAAERQPAPPAQPGVKTGQGFTLGEGDSIWLEEHHIEVILVAVLEDSRCPQGVQCFWEGSAKVLVKVGEQEYVLTLGGLREGDQNAVQIADGLTLRVLEINPYPGSPQEGQPYQVTLVVETETSHPYNYPENV